MSISMTQIEAEMSLFEFDPEKRPYYWTCKVCGNKFKTEGGTYHHIARKDHDKAVYKAMDCIIEPSMTLTKKKRKIK